MIVWKNSIHTCDNAKVRLRSAKVEIKHMFDDGFGDGLRQQHDIRSCDLPTWDRCATCRAIQLYAYID
jgi:hypothetical protein